MVSNRAGRVLELLVDRGDVVTPGTPLLNLEVVSDDLVAVLFVPATAGERIEPGMPVRISPSTVRREEFGSILGRVVWAAEYPSTSRGMVRLLGNEALVDKLMREGPPDPGRTWPWSGTPRPRPASAGLPRKGLVSRSAAAPWPRATWWSAGRRPVNLVIPNVREKLGF